MCAAPKLDSKPRPRRKHTLVDHHPSLDLIFLSYTGGAAGRAAAAAAAEVCGGAATRA